MDKGGGAMVLKVEDYDKFNEFKKARFDAGLSKEEIYEEIKLPISTLLKWENDKRTPPEHVRILYLAWLKSKTKK